MKNRLSLFCVLLAVTIASPLLAAAPTAPAEEGSTELGEHMSTLSRAFKKLRQQIADPARNDDSLKLVATIRESAAASLELNPEKTADLPEADQPKFKAGFTAKMESFLAEVVKLEHALQAGNNDDAAKIAEALANAQKEGHREFRKKKPEKK